MSRKKTNPSNIPVSISEAEARQIIDEEANRMLLCSWAVVLCALTSRHDTSADSMMAFCEDVNAKSSKLRTCGEVTACLAELEELTGKTFPFYSLSINHIRSKGDVERLRRKSAISAMHSMFALIADAVLTHHLMEKEEVQFLFQKAYVIAQDFHAGEISIGDLLWVLQEEYGLSLAMRGTNVVLEHMEERGSEMMKNIV